MDMPQPSPSLSIASSSTALAAIFLALLAVSDFTNSNLPEEVASYLWSSQAPVRLAFFFGLTGFSYLGKTGGKDGIIGKVRIGVRGSVCNSLVFTWAFVEMLAWFYVSWLLIRNFGLWGLTSWRSTLLSVMIGELCYVKQSVRRPPRRIGYEEPYQVFELQPQVRLIRESYFFN